MLKSLLNVYLTHMDVSENNGTPKSSILVGFSIINHPFWGTPILETSVWLHKVSYMDVTYLTSSLREIHSSTHTPLAQDRSRGRRRDRGERNRPSEVGHPFPVFRKGWVHPATMFVGSFKNKGITYNMSYWVSLF